MLVWLEKLARGFEPSHTSRLQSKGEGIATVGSIPILASPSKTASTSSSHDIHVCFLWFGVVAWHFCIVHSGTQPTIAAARSGAPRRRDLDADHCLQACFPPQRGGTLGSRAYREAEFYLKHIEAYEPSTRGLLVCLYALKAM